MHPDQPRRILRPLVFHQPSQITASWFWFLLRSHQWISTTASRRAYHRNASWPREPAPSSGPGLRAFVSARIDLLPGGGVAFAAARRPQGRFEDVLLGRTRRAFVAASDASAQHLELSGPKTGPLAGYDELL